MKFHRLFVAAYVLVLSASRIVSAANPVIETTYDEARAFLGNRAAKAIVFYPCDEQAAGRMGPTYLLDFTKNPLELEYMDSAMARAGDPFISPDGTRWTWCINTAYPGVGGKIYVAELKAGAPNKHYICDGHKPRWWVHPETGDEYIISSSIPWSAGGDITGKTYIQKLVTGTCEPDGPRKVLIDGLAFGGGRTPSGRYLFTTHPGFAEIDLGADSLAVENASYTLNDGGGRRCNSSVSIDPAHPHRHLFAPHGHSTIQTWDGLTLTMPDDGSPDDLFYQGQEWSTHPDFLVACPVTPDDFETPIMHWGVMYSWSQDKWLTFVDHIMSAHLWVSTCDDQTAPSTDPTGLDTDPISYDSVGLSWNAAQDPDCDGIKRYDIYRKTGSGDFVFLNAVGTTSYTDIGLQENATYEYYVVAVNSNGITSQQSNTATVTTPADARGPSIEIAQCLSSTEMRVVYDQTVGSSAIDANNYSLSGGMAVSSISFVTGSQTEVLLGLSSALELNTDYTLSVSDVKDMAATPNTIAAGTQVTVSFDVTTGTVLLDIFEGLDGFDKLEASPRFPDEPDYTDTLSELAYNEIRDYGYGARVAAYLVPPTTGTYKLLLCADRLGRLYFSTDESVDNKQLVLENPGWMMLGAYTDDISYTVELEAGSIYYLETLHYDNHGGDHMAIAWEGPGIVQQEIPARYLAPCVIRKTEPTVPAPTFGPPDGTAFSNNLTVTIGCSDSEAQIRYTTDGSEPTESSDLYTAGISVTKTTTVRARAYNGSFAPSPIASATYTKNAAGEILSPNGGESFSIGDTMVITWKTNDPDVFNAAELHVMTEDKLTISFALTTETSPNYGSTEWGEFKWVIPADYNGMSLNNKSFVIALRQYQGSLIDETDAAFCIGTCESPVNTDIARMHSGKPFSIVRANNGRSAFRIRTDGRYQLRVYNMKGACVWNVAGRKNAEHVLPAALAAQTYLARAQVDGKVMTKRFVVER